MTELKYILSRLAALNEFGGVDPLETFGGPNIYDEVFFTKMDEEQEATIEAAIRDLETAEANC